jgi:hypothetical protein
LRVAVTVTVSDTRWCELDVDRRRRVAGTGCRVSANPPARTMRTASPPLGRAMANLPSAVVVTCR